MRLPLRARLFLLHAIVVVVALAAIVLVESRTQRRWLIERDVQSLERGARLAAASPAVRAPAASESWTFVAASLDSLLHVRVTIIEADGVVLGDSRADAHTLENHGDRPEVRAALAGTVGHDVRRSRTLGLDLLYVAVPVHAASPAAVLRVAEPLEIVARFDRSLIRLWLVAAFTALLVGSLAAWWLTGRDARRLQALEQIALRIGRGDAAPRAPEQPSDALGRLGSALNSMAAELRARVAALERERDDRERILAHMSDGVALVDEAGRVIHVNHRLAVVLEAPRPAAAGTPFQEFVRIPELDELLQRARDAGHTVERELRVWTPSARLVRATATPLAGGSPGSVLLVVHDLTEAEALARMRHEFVANASHELRTPLTSLRGYAETLLEGGLEDREHRAEFVTIIRDQAVRLQALVDDLLSLAELERSDATLRRERFDLREAAQRQASTLRDAAARGGLVLGVEAGAPVPVVADRARIEQAIANLLDNAVKYTERGRVDVAVGAGDGLAWLEVRDTGPGIPPEDQPRVFERFYRVDKTRSREKGGTGLGLSIVKHVIGLHGGTVRVESAPGEGSSFRFEIPSSA